MGTMTLNFFMSLVSGGAPARPCGVMSARSGSGPTGCCRATMAELPRDRAPVSALPQRRMVGGIGREQRIAGRRSCREIAAPVVSGSAQACCVGPGTQFCDGGAGALVLQRREQGLRLREPALSLSRLPQQAAGDDEKQRNERFVLMGTSETTAP
jgi:hypothetical protein